MLQYAEVSIYGTSTLSLLKMKLFRLQANLFLKINFPVVFHCRTYETTHRPQLSPLVRYHRRAAVNVYMSVLFN